MQEKSSLEFAGRLAQAMANRGIKAARLAEITGVSKGYLSELLKGKKVAPSFEVIKKFAEVLECSPRDLLPGPYQEHFQPSPSTDLEKETEALRRKIEDIQAKIRFAFDESKFSMMELERRMKAAGAWPPSESDKKQTPGHLWAKYDPALTESATMSKKRN